MAPHRVIEEKEEQQHKMEKAFEDLYMTATGCFIFFLHHTDCDECDNNGHPFTLESSSIPVLPTVYSLHVSPLICAFYAALLPRRGPHIASHSVCLSVCPSVPLSVRPSRYIVTERHVAPPSELQ